MHKIVIGLRWVFVGLLVAVAPTLSAQDVPQADWEEQLIWDWGEEEELSGNMDNLLDDLDEWRERKVNINDADSAQLASLRCLTARQIEGILFYLYRYQRFYGVGELMLVPELDYATRRVLAQRVSFDPPEGPTLAERWRDVWHYGKHKTSTRLDVPLYRREGYRPRTAGDMAQATSQYYMGNALYHQWRYQFQHKKLFSCGFTVEKDAGEPIFNRVKPFYDHISGWVQCGDMGCLEQLVIGNYRLRFGQGLVLNSDYALGKSMLMSSLQRLPGGIKPHRGTGESGYYTGAAATFRWKVWSLTAFAAYNRYDATLDGASVKTFYDDGYHRTPGELQREHNTKGNLFGLHGGFDAKGWHVGTTLMYRGFNRNIARSDKPYKIGAPYGHRFANASIDYAYFHHRFSVQGETAIDAKGAMATINMLRWKVADPIRLTLLHRYYAWNYWSLEGKSFATGSTLRGEQGLYVGADWTPARKWLVSGYADVTAFPIQRYRVSAPSKAFDAELAGRYNDYGQHSLLMRYRFRLKQRDVAEGYVLPDGGLLNQCTHRARVQYRREWSDRWCVQAMMDACVVQQEKLSYGAILGGWLGYSWDGRGKVSAGVSGFWTTDYAARLYGYEQGLLYAYNYQSYYGKGLRGWMMATYKIASQLTAVVKLGGTWYADRSVIGNGAAAINAPHREDVQIQVRYAF